MQNPLFVLDGCFQGADPPVSIPERLALLKQLGYAGVSSTLDDDASWTQLPELMRQVDCAGLQLLSIAVSVDVSTGVIDDRVSHAIHHIAGRTTLLELSLAGSSEHDQPSSPRADARAAAIIRRFADLAAAARVRVSLVPRTNFWMERVEDAVRLGMRVNRPEIGMTFRMVDWLATDGEQLDARLQLALPRLWNVVVSGATWRGPRDCAAEPLDRGAFDVAGFLKSLGRLGYAGPMALQGSDWVGEVYDNLKRSMTTYREMGKH